MKRKIIIFALMIVMILGGCSSVKKLIASENITINTKEELYQEVQDTLKAGKSEFTFVTEELGREDLDQLNLEHDGFYGSVDRYQIKTIQFLNRSYITLYCDISDNYFVEDAVLNGTQLSEDQKKAIELKTVCEAVLKETGDNSESDYQKEKKIHDYIVKSVEYGYPDSSRDEESDAYNAYGALVKGKAVCNGYAQAMKLLCDLCGIECEMVTGMADGENHAWNLIRLDEEWYHTDVTWDDPEPDDPSRILYSYFNLDDTQMEISHIWEGGKFPQAKGTKYNYYLKNNLHCEDFDAFKETCKEIFEKDNPRSIQFLVEDYDAELYSEENMQFLFQYSGADSIHIQTVGKDPCTTLYFTLDYN